MKKFAHVDSVFSEMDRVINSDEHKSIFKGASKKDDKKEDEDKSKDKDKKKTKEDFFGKKKDKKEDKKAKKAQIITALAKISEVLDDCGYVKSSLFAMKALDELAACDKDMNDADDEDGDSAYEERPTSLLSLIALMPGGRQALKKLNDENRKKLLEIDKDLDLDSNSADDVVLPGGTIRSEKAEKAEREKAKREAEEFGMVGLLKGQKGKPKPFAPNDPKKKDLSKADDSGGHSFGKRDLDSLLEEYFEEYQKDDDTDATAVGMLLTAKKIGMSKSDLVKAIYNLKDRYGEETVGKAVEHIMALSEDFPFDNESAQKTNAKDLSDRKYNDLAQGLFDSDSNDFIKTDEMGKYDWQSSDRRKKDLNKADDSNDVRVFEPTHELEFDVKDFIEAYEDGNDADAENIMIMMLSDGKKLGLSEGDLIKFIMRSRNVRKMGKPEKNKLHESIVKLIQNFPQEVIEELGKIEQSKESEESEDSFADDSNDCGCGMGCDCDHADKQLMIEIVDDNKADDFDDGFIAKLLTFIAEPYDEDFKKLYDEYKSLKISKDKLFKLIDTIYDDSSHYIAEEDIICNNDILKELFDEADNKGFDDNKADDFGIPEELLTEIMDEDEDGDYGYEPCATCGFDHEYDLDDEDNRKKSNKAHLKNKDHEDPALKDVLDKGTLEALLKEIGEEIGDSDMSLDDDGVHESYELCDTCGFNHKFDLGKGRNRRKSNRIHSKRKDHHLRDGLDGEALEALLSEVGGESQGFSDLSMADDEEMTIPDNKELVRRVLHKLRDLIRGNIGRDHESGFNRTDFYNLVNNKFTNNDKKYILENMPKASSEEYEWARMILTGEDDLLEHGMPDEDWDGWTREASRRRA